MELLVLLVISSLSVICLADSQQIDRQNDNYDSRYKSTDSSSYGTSGGYYPRTAYEQFNQNRFNTDLSPNGKEFRPPNVFAPGFIPSPTSFASPLMAQPRQYQMSLAGGPSGLMPYHMSGSPFLQSSAIYGMPGMLGHQLPGLSAYGGVPTRLGMGDTMTSASQGLGYGNLASDPYYGAGNRYPMGGSPLSSYTGYSSPGALGYLAQSPNYQTLSYANPMLSRGYAYGFGPQFAGHPYQSSPFGAYNGYNNNYNNYNNNGIGSGGLTQGGITDGIRDEKSYASSASTQTETHSDGQSSNQSPVFESSRMDKRIDRKTRRMFADQKMIE